MTTASDDFSDLTDDDHASRESRELLGMLQRKGHKLSGEYSLPKSDDSLNKSILSDARSRSQEIRDAASLIAGTERNERIQPVPLWLKLCWVMAILAIIALIVYQQSLPN